MTDDKKWIKFDKLNQHYEDLISSGDFSGDEYDRVSTILGQIYKIEDQSSGIYDGLSSDKERNAFLEDFYNVAEYLKANPSKKLIIHAHNDELEDSLATAYEDLRKELENLDQKRGDYIKTRLMEVYGISEDRIIIIAENAMKPNEAEMTEDDDPNDRELKLAYNRRVVFELTDK
jgi:outer membrane protein OmpA-like peptidoglycan-associated protein